ncbi:MAG: TIGR04211 family SH3 domain-containing protein [Gammaproteobacteria bacterium]|nr:TIGR04211 family SH3 domain-containing protein [Gammaproteobacteria bacterium]MCP5417912.1 TIGR04211 family SH3 domain-containing protein [Chromatiaceae bacterium]
MNRTDNYLGVAVNRIVLSLVLLFGFGQLQAENRYVTDQFQITMRTGESTSHKILRMLPSGEKLELISSNPASGYSQVRTQDGSSGYVLTRQLLTVPVARDRLSAAENRLKELLQEPEKLSAKLEAAQRELAALQSSHQKLGQEKERVDQDLETIRRTSSNAIRISNERNDLQKQVAQLTHLVEGLKQENRELKNNSNQKWFMIGAAIIILGIIIGLILPHLRFQRRKNSWGSL